jgi:hypothetical protein
MLDNPGTLDAMRQKADSFTVPEDFKGNPSEFKRRSLEGLQRVMGNEYMLAIQNEKSFDLKASLAKLSANETPSSLHHRAATMENKVLTAGENVDPSTRLRNATMDQQKFLEAGATALRDEKIKTGTVGPEGITAMAKQTSGKGLNPADVANYAALTEGVAIPASTLAAVAAVPKETVSRQDKDPAPAASPATAPAPAQQKPVAAAATL